KITVIFGRKITKQHRGKLQTEIEDMHLPNPVIRSHYRNGFVKQYVRDHLILRLRVTTSTTTASTKQSRISPIYASACQKSKKSVIGANSSASVAGLRFTERSFYDSFWP